VVYAGYDPWVYMPGMIPGCIYGVHSLPVYTLPMVHTPYMQFELGEVKRFIPNINEESLLP